MGSVSDAVKFWATCSSSKCAHTKGGCDPGLLQQRRCTDSAELRMRVPAGHRCPTSLSSSSVSQAPAGSLGKRCTQ